MTNDKGLAKYIPILSPPLQRKTFILYCLFMFAFSYQLCRLSADHIDVDILPRIPS